jgi:shikimate dehydrogenase
VRRAFRCAVDAVPLDGAVAGALREATLLVQATTVGAGAERSLSPVAEAALHPRLFVMDMIYNPEETVLLRAARAAGCRILGGLPMLVYLGARAFEIWTGRPAPLPVMRRAVGLSAAAA